MTEYRFQNEYRDVLAAARAYLAEHGEVELSAAYQDLAGRLGVKTNPYGATEKQVWDTFRGQVQRAFAKLAGEGGLRRVGANRAGPDGNYARSARYFTDAAWEAAHARGEAADAQARHEAERWLVVHGRLGALGILIHDAGSPAWMRAAPRLPLHQWERLLDLAEAARLSGLATPR
jgi:hypothetical protein